MPYKALYQQGRWKNEMDFQDFERKLVALETLAAGRIRVSSSANEVYLRQAPEQILGQIEHSLRGEGHDIPEAKK